MKRNEKERARLEILEIEREKQAEIEAKLMEEARIK